MDKLSLIRKMPISAIISKYVKLKPHGVIFTGDCPFCPSPKRTLLVSDHCSNYQCTEDGGSGDAIMFIMNLKDISYEEAIELIIKDLLSN